ncbi:hypothetical protein [Acaryochloris sp. IP29b_bin.148]|uniref:hypothetical protein n=1 Tax=Acaryochloris sp. IP29b_bin.148 TaxID=2969218 RepID=UPI0026291F74|nr:hypothetical protein [Acaryochloris sp. IP29b_bin.148]
MDSQHRTLIVFSHAAMIVVLMIALLWVSNSWTSLDSGSSWPMQEQNFLVKPFTP